MSNTAGRDKAKALLRQAWWAAKGAATGKSKVELLVEDSLDDKPWGPTGTQMTGARRVSCAGAQACGRCPTRRPTAVVAAAAVPARALLPSAAVQPIQARTEHQHPPARPPRRDLRGLLRRRKVQAGVGRHPPPLRRAARGLAPRVRVGWGPGLAWPQEHPAPPPPFITSRPPTRRRYKALLLTEHLLKTSSQHVVQVGGLAGGVGIAGAGCAPLPAQHDTV